MRDFSSPLIKYPNISELIAICLICGIFPTIVIYLVENQLEAKAKLETLRKRNQNSDSEDEIESGDKITLCGQTKESITFLSDNFIYAEVIKNYVTICFIEKGQIICKPIRSTLAHIMESMQDYPQIIRCHRAFLVNTSQIEQMDKTSGGGQLVLKSTDTPIPVSRTYIKNVEELLQS
ncbi:LytTR family transcriptional regulator [Bacteroidales bacterium OttesenSCG-928-J19]|nr:LytTR family transcriptional regulator [Bacteroidales bacterium OttesenSCG-928-J19]